MAALDNKYEKKMQYALDIKRVKRIKAEIETLTEIYLSQNIKLSIILFPVLEIRFEKLTSMFMFGWLTW